MVLGSFCDGVGIVLVTFWGRFGVVFSTVFSFVGIVLGSFWDGVGILF